MPDNRGRDVFWLGQLFLGFRLRISQPCNVEIVISCRDGVTREAAPATFLTLILAFAAAVSKTGTRLIATSSRNK
jgi:hypothetical protein